MSTEDVPLLEFDEDKAALIEPHFFAHARPPLPEHCVMPIYGSVIDALQRAGKIEKIHELSQGTAGPLFSMGIFKAGFEGKHVTVAFPGIGAPFAAAMFEELIALGCRKFVACGSGGVLKPELRRGMVIVPSAAVRDEGTSYHYLPPARSVVADPSVIQKLEATLVKHHIRYEVGKTWTTDAFYRETKSKISRRKGEGCLMVDMECAAFLAVAQFRGVAFGQYLGAGDDVSGDEWGPRYIDDKTPFHERLFWLSVEACLSL